MELKVIAQGGVATPVIVISKTFNPLDENDVPDPEKLAQMIQSVAEKVRNSYPDGIRGPVLEIVSLSELDSNALIDSLKRTITAVWTDSTAYFRIPFVFYGNGEITLPSTYGAIIQISPTYVFEKPKGSTAKT